MSIEITATQLPPGFEELERWTADWVKPSRDERYQVRLSKTIHELGEFYDAIAARAEDAMTYLDALDIDALPHEAFNLQQLLYSMILVSYPVNLFFQPNIPDSGATFFFATLEPAV